MTLDASLLCVLVYQTARRLSSLTLAYLLEAVEPVALLGAGLSLRLLLGLHLGAALLLRGNCVDNQMPGVLRVNPADVTANPLALLMDLLDTLGGTVHVLGSNLAHLLPFVDEDYSTSPSGQSQILWYCSLNFFASPM